MTSYNWVPLSEKDKISCCLGYLNDNKCYMGSSENPEGNPDGDYSPDWDNSKMTNDCQSLQLTYCRSNKAYNTFNKEIKGGENQEFCGCHYPVEYYDEIANNLLSNYDNLDNIALLGDRHCWAPSCANASNFVKKSTPCGNTTIVNCVNTINFNNEGFIKGDIKILGNINCKAMGQYLNEQNKLPGEDNNKTTTDNKLKKKIKVIFYDDDDEIKVLPVIIFVIFLIILSGGIIISFISLFSEKKEINI